MPVRLFLIGVISVFAFIIHAQSDPSELSELLKKHEQAIRSLETKSGKARLDQQFLGALRKLASESTNPSEKARVESAIDLVSKPGFPQLPAAADFAKLARLLKVYAASLEPIRSKAGPNLKRLDAQLKKLLEQMADKSTGTSRDAVLAVIRKRFGEVTGMAVTQSKPTPKGDSTGTLFRFSVLQEQLEPPKPRLVVSTIASTEDLSGTLEGKSAVELAERVVGTELPLVDGKLEAPGISRTLLIYSGDGEERKVAGTILLRGTELQLDNRGGTDTAPELRLELGKGTDKPKMKSGQLLILQKEKDFSGLFKIKAGPSTISVRGTQVFIMPENGDVDSPQGAGGDQAAVMLVRDGVVQAELNGGAPVPIEKGSENMVDLLTLKRLPADLRTKLGAVYDNKLKYYPGPTRWLVTDFDADGDGFGPLVDCSSPRGKIANERKRDPENYSLLLGGNGSVTLSFPPVDLEHFRYLKFDAFWEGKGKSRLIVYCGNGDLSDQNVLFYDLGRDYDSHSHTIKLPDPKGGTKNGTRFWYPIVIDLWGKTGELKSMLPSNISAISIHNTPYYTKNEDLSKIRRTNSIKSIDNVEFVASINASDPEDRSSAILYRTFQDSPPRSGDYHNSSDGASLFRRQREMENAIFQDEYTRAPERVHLVHEVHLQKGTSPQVIEWFDEHISGGENWARHFHENMPGKLFGPSVNILRQKARHLVANGCKELAIDLYPTDILALVSQVSSYGEPGEGRFSDLAFTFDQHGASKYLIRNLEELFVFGDKAPKVDDESLEDWEGEVTVMHGRENKFGFPRKTRYIDFFSKLHEEALEQLAKHANPEGKPVTFHSILVWGQQAQQPDIIQALHRDPSGKITRETP